MLVPGYRLPGWVRRALAFARPRPTSLPLSNSGPTAGAAPGADAQAFEAFFWQYERQIVAYLCRMLSDEQTAYDLSQETFFRAWQHFASIRHQPGARAWLFRTATNLALHALRSRRAHPQEAIADDLLSASDPGRRVAEHDLVNAVLQRLAPRQRSALLLNEVYGLSCDEIGTLLGMSRDAVKMALWRGREQFRQHYLREEADR
jgi:RNA polymerase sigma-70 factor (ECF subfamily)